jgi:aminoglycoside phosphotransferase (APT) family kinase protein
MKSWSPLVRQLIDTQFPEWCDLPVTPVRSAGTDNAIYRLGANLAVRLPCRPEANGQAEKEYRWLPKLAPALPLEVPVPIVLGRPSEGYPYHWSVCRWLTGETAVQAKISDLAQVVWHRVLQSET